MKKLLLLLAVLGMALPAWGRSEEGSIQVCLTRAEVDAGTCGPTMTNTAHVGKIVVILDGTSLHDCTGGGSTEVLCEWDGTQLLAVNLPFANGDFILNSPDATFDFTRDTGQGTVTITASDQDGNAALTVRAGGSGILKLGATANSSASIVTDGGTVSIDGTIGTNADITVDDSQTEAFGAANEYGESAATRANLNQIVGIPKLGVTYFAALNDGTASVAAADPATGTCNAIANGAEADNTTISVTGNSYRYTWASDVAADDGIDCVIAYPATDDVDSFGFWFRTDTAIASGDIHINFDDGGVEECSYETFAVTTLDEWQWVELDVSTVCDSKGDGTDGVEFLATAQGGGAAVLDDAIMYIDHMAMWKVGDEEAIGDIRVGGLIDFAYGKDAADQVNKLVVGVEWTSHFINYQSGADAIVPITDLSSFWGKTLEALE